MIDSKSKKPLFNAEAWNKADNVLKEIMCGFYSDPPGFEMYNKKLRNGKVMQNKYGMDMIECCRGTNRTEAYHKQLVTTFGSWHTGVEMSDCLLAERRHRHNHTVSEMRRYGFPKYGHKNTWKIDQYQNLYLANHGCPLYPHWTNASDYKCTDESFDTVALHDDELHKAMMKEFSTDDSQDPPIAARLNLKNIKLTRDQQYMADAMGTKLPFLPFCGEDEYKRWAKYVMERDGPSDDVKASLDWCKFVDGKTIHPKLPSQIRCYIAKVDRNQRTRNCTKRSKSGIELLAELNTKLVPISDTQKEPTGKDNAQLLSNNGVEQISQPHPSPLTKATTRPCATVHGDSHHHSPEIGSELVQNTTRKRQGPVHNWKEPRLPPAMPVPPAHALHNLPRSIVGVFCVGAAPAPKANVKVVRNCKRCKKHGPKGENFDPCKGRGGERFCTYYTENGDHKTPTTIRHCQRHCQRCVRFNGYHAGACNGRQSEDFCIYFQPSGNRKSQPKRRRKI